MTTPLPQPTANRRPSTTLVAGSADWLRLARIARLLSGLTLAWMGIEGGVAIAAAVVAGSVALLGSAWTAGSRRWRRSSSSGGSPAPGWPARRPSGAPSSWWR
jgi:hypothetical protein